MLGVSRGERVLEIGVGTGRTLARVADAVGLEGHVYGVDLSDEWPGSRENCSARTTSLHAWD